MERSQTELQTSYDRVAAEYAKRFYDELDRKPFDCKMLAWFIEKGNGVGTVCDLGCVQTSCALGICNLITSPPTSFDCAQLSLTEG